MRSGQAADIHQFCFRQPGCLPFKRGSRRAAGRGAAMDGGGILQPWAEVDRAERLAELRDALARQPPEIPCKFLYGPVGSALFERITLQPEYYPTRCERELLRAEAPNIVAALGGRVDQVV